MIDQIVYRCPTKATDREGDRLRFSLNWALARRAELRLTTSALECGDWVIPYDRIDDAVLVAVPFGRDNAYNLRIKAMGTTYQFQLKSTSPRRAAPDPFWFGPTPLALRHEVGRVDWWGPTRLGLAVLLLFLILEAAKHLF